MGMMRIPLSWSTKMNKANIKSLDYKNEALQQQKEMMYNQMSGMAYGMRTEVNAKKQQVALYEQNIIPALKKNFQTMQIGYQQNTEELFMLYDAWEALNMSQIEYLNQVQQLLEMQVQLEKVLEVQ
jgi:outer membrane protein TolC